MSDWFRASPKLSSSSKKVFGGGQPSGGLHRLPALPAIPPPSRPWTKATTPTGGMPIATPTDELEKKQHERRQRVAAQVVMHQFARSEVRQLDQGQDGLLYQQVGDQLWSMPEFANYSVHHMQALLTKITFMLQSAELTINFDAGSWFSKPNEYNSYTQMYERGTTVVETEDGKRELRLKGNALNPADERDRADARVTFGANINSPDRGGIARLMSTGEVVATDQADQFRIRNGQFNPKARQIFAGLNYGRRPRGSNIQYGRCKLVLRDDLKRNAIYYMGDTFLEGINSSHRVSYGTLTAVLLHATPQAVNQILDSCFRLMQLEDTDDMRELLEAHIFEPVQFRHDVAEIVIDDSLTTPDIKKNAEAFAKKHGINKLRFGIFT
jgi:hypothetical protein